MATDINYLINRRNKIEEELKVLSEKDRNELSHEDMTNAIALANEHATLSATFGALEAEDIHQLAIVN